jgi:hypothetical protein
MSAMGSLVTTESQDTCLTSHLKDSTLHRAMSKSLPWGILFHTREKSATYWTSNTTSSSICSPIQYQPCLASKASQQWDAGWNTAGQSGMLLCFIALQKAFVELKLVLNADKTNYMLFSKSHKNVSDHLCIHILDGTFIDHVPA